MPVSHRVFAYGSNMHLPDLGRYLRARELPPGALGSVRPAALPGYRLMWNYRSKVRGGGAANVERFEFDGACAFEGAELYGLVLEVDQVLLNAIDVKEGHPARYVRERASVVYGDGVTAEAWVYVVRPEHCVGEFVAPRAEYLELMIAAAEQHRLPADYVDALRRTPALFGP